MNVLATLWKVLTYRNSPSVFATHGRGPVRPSVSTKELELVALEVDPRTRRLRIAAVRRSAS